MTKLKGKMIIFVGISNPSMIVWVWKVYYVEGLNTFIHSSTYYLSFNPVTLYHSKDYPQWPIQLFIRVVLVSFYDISQFQRANYHEEPRRDNDGHSL